MYLKITLNILNITLKIQIDNHNNQTFGIARLDNMKNSEMNNLMNFDFAMRDWIDDTDLMLPRISAEFPRASASYANKKQNQTKPWGEKADPIYTDPFMDENLMRLNDHYEPGIWYYTGYPLTDHHEFCGVPNVWRHFQTLFGLEYRPGFYINIYNRIRNLEFPEDQAYGAVRNKQPKGFTSTAMDSLIGSEMLETEKGHRSSDFSFTEYLEQEIDYQACNIKSFQLNIDDDSSGIKGLLKKNASLTNLRSHLPQMPDMG